MVRRSNTSFSIRTHFHGRSLKHTFLYSHSFSQYVAQTYVSLFALITEAGRSNTSVSLFALTFMVRRSNTSFCIRTHFHVTSLRHTFLYSHSLSRYVGKTHLFVYSCAMTRLIPQTKVFLCSRRHSTLPNMRVSLFLLSTLARRSSIHYWSFNEGVINPFQLIRATFI
jgi:hypothetical protein